jgi:hypothetical protein
MNLKSYILTLINELNNKIRFIEEIGSSNKLDITKDTAYIILVTKRETLRDVLEYLELNNGSKISRFSRK